MGQDDDAVDKSSGLQRQHQFQFDPSGLPDLLPCTAPVGDLHCSATPVAGSYAAGAYVNGLHLWARDATGREFASFYAMYKLTIPAP